jgi:Nucleotide modification associated domain 2
MRLHSYIVEHDMGFAPNPFYGVCSLAACKPKIRKYARLGEYVIGTGTAKRELQGRLVHLMKVSNIIGFDDYWADPKFARKRAVMNGSLIQRYGDNIYHRNPITGAWIQEDSFHSSEKGGKTNLDNLHVDTGSTDRVLLAEWFIYWGDQAPQIPQRFSKFVHPGIGEKRIEDDGGICAFLEWANSQGEPAVLGDPCEWKYPPKKRRKEAA